MHLSPCRAGLGRFVRSGPPPWATALLAVVLCLLPAMPAGAQEDDAAAAPAAAAPAAAPETAQPTSVLVYIVKAAPLFFFLLLITSVYLVAMFIINFQATQLKKVVPPDLLGNLDTLLAEKKYKEAYEVVKGDDSLFGRALTAGVERLGQGFERASDAMMTVVDDGRMAMEHRITPIATIGSIGPMVGLMGTVYGMILAFQEISLGGTPRPAELAENIALALVTTLEGIIAALPAIIFFALLRNRVARAGFECETLGEMYLHRFSGALKK